MSRPHTTPEARPETASSRLELRSSLDLESEVFAEQIASVYRLTPFTLAVSVAGSTLLLLVLWQADLTEGLIPWYLFHHLVYAGRYALLRAYQRAEDKAADARLWARRFVLGTFGAGVVWALPVSLLMPDIGEPARFFVAMSAVVVTASGMFSLAPYFRAYLPLATLPLLTLAVSMIATGIRSEYLTGAGILLFLYIVLVNARRFEAMTRDSIRLRLGYAQLAEDRARASEAAERASQAKTQFLANISHEIRTPMTGVLGLTQLLLAGELSPLQRERTESLLKAGESLLRLLNDVLDLTRNEAGQLRLEHINFDLHQLVNDVGRLYAHSAQQQGLHLDCHVDANIPRRAMGDPFRLRQILSNLVSNAVKFTERGTIEVHLERRPREEVQRLSLRFHVRDTGIGIPPEASTNLFTPFSQADDSMSRRYGGTGLGLAICQQLVSSMGGSIRYDSSDKGSHFYVDVDLDEAADIPEQSGDESRLLSHRLVAEGGRLRILLVDDNETNQILVKAMLELIGDFEVMLAGDGRIALDRFREADLILMDCQMPIMDGYSAARGIRERERQEGRKTVPIIALTAHALDSERQRCIEAGMSEFLSKPVLMQQLSTKLEAVLPVLRRRPKVRSTDSSPGH